MARIRSIKPGFFASEDVADLTIRARLTWIGLWTHADDAGRAKDNVRLIKAAIWSLDDDMAFRDIEADLEELADKGRIVRYEVNGKPYLQVTNWTVHQRIQKPSPSAIPPPTDGSSSPTGNLPDPYLSTTDQGKHPSHTTTRWKGEGKEREGERASAPPPNPTRCPNHQTQPAPGPCTACADARTTHQHQPTNTGAPQPTDPRCPKPGHQHEHANACRTCRSEALAPPEPFIRPADPTPITDLGGPHSTVTTTTPQRQP